MRAVWKGSISFGMVNIPIKLYSASKKGGVSFNQLCGDCGSKLKYKRWCPTCEKEVEWENVKKGFKIKKGEYVELEKEELEAVQPKSSKTIELEKFISLGEVNRIYVEKPYYVVPQEAGEKAYSLFREALSITGKAGIGRFVLRNKEHLIALRAYKEGILLLTLRFKDQIRDLSRLEELKRLEEVEEEKLQLSEKLVEKLSGKFKAKEYKNEYEERLKEVVEKKARGEKIKAKKVKEEKKEESLEEKLKASVEAK